MNNVSFRNDVLPLKNELFRLALRITLDRADAEDVVQETMIKVWSKRDSWDDIDNVEAFAMTICRNLALDHAKRRENDNERLDADNVREPVAPSNPFEQAVNQDRVQIVRRIVDNLPEKQRSCIQLRDFEGKQYKEIATILAITEEQVKVNIFRARQTIKQKFLEAEAFHAKHRESK